MERSRPPSSTGCRQTGCNVGARRTARATACSGSSRSSCLRYCRLRPHAPQRRRRRVLRRAGGDQPGDRDRSSNGCGPSTAQSPTTSTLSKPLPARCREGDSHGRSPCRRRRARRARGTPARPPRLRRAEPRRHDPTATRPALLRHGWCRTVKVAGPPHRRPRRPSPAPAQRSETATCSRRSIASCMPASIPESMIASRTSLLGHCTRIVRVVRPSASVNVSVFRVPSPSGTPS